MLADRPVWGPPYTQAELEDAQARFGLVFPPDLVAMLREHRLAQGYDWTRDDDRIRDMLRWPLEGILFDVENDELWWPEWGDRPLSVVARRAVLTEVVGAAPKLIPLYGHRYIPEAPHEAGNPVFSVYQADIIVYGANLEDYVRHEFGETPSSSDKPTTFIPFWSEMVARERQNTRPAR